MSRAVVSITDISDQFPFKTSSVQLLAEKLLFSGPDYVTVVTARWSLSAAPLRSGPVCPWEKIVARVVNFIDNHRDRPEGLALIPDGEVDWAERRLDVSARRGASWCWVGLTGGDGEGVATASMVTRTVTHCTTSLALPRLPAPTSDGDCVRLSRIWRGSALSTTRQRGLAGRGTAVQALTLLTSKIHFYLISLSGVISYISLVRVAES